MPEHMPIQAQARWAQAQRLGERALSSLFYDTSDLFARVVRAGWMAALFVLGLLLWGIFYSWGNISLDFLDWAEVTGPRYALLKDAVTKGQLPLHAQNLTALRGVTDRYFSIADTPFSPQILLLRSMDITEYLFFDAALFYAIGFLGLVLIARKYRLAPLAFLLLFLLFNFNGYITAHMAVGHSIWTGYFLLPYFVLLVLDLLEREQAGWKWVLLVGIALVAILLQGFFHLYLWCLMFLALLGLFNPRLIRPIALAGVFAVLLALPRLLPPALNLAEITGEFLGGFPTVTDLFSSMVVLGDPNRAILPATNLYPLNWWEMDYFIGLLGFAFIAVFGILAPIAHDRSPRSMAGQVFLASLALTAFSLGQVFAYILRVMPVPPFTGERVTARMFGLVLVFLIVLAAIFFQREIERRRPASWLQALLIGISALLFHDLYQHRQAWRVRYLDGLVNIFPKVPFDPAHHTIGNHPDPLYTGLLLGGLLVSLLALAFLLWRVWRERSVR